MQLSNILTLGLAAAAAAVPVSEDANASLTARADRGSYTVGGLGSRKQAILNAGGNTLDIAIAMLETENMSTGYTYGTCLEGLSNNTLLRPRNRRRQDAGCCQLWPLQAKLGHAP
jgi:hypothetical protein